MPKPKLRLKKRPPQSGVKQRELKSGRPTFTATGQRTLAGDMAREVLGSHSRVEVGGRVEKCAGGGRLNSTGGRIGSNRAGRSQHGSSDLTYWNQQNNHVSLALEMWLLELPVPVDGREDQIKAVAREPIPTTQHLPKPAATSS